jgi:hypothetical protein
MSVGNAAPGGADDGDDVLGGEQNCMRMNLHSLQDKVDDGVGRGVNTCARKEEGCDDADTGATGTAA